ncbi:MAG TPA: hypothetical protein DCW44_02815 [Eubacterium sp.]|nr:hypothetical protein [Eubacterium sp.]
MNKEGDNMGENTLSLKEIRNNIIRINNNIENYCGLKKIEFEKTQPKAIMFDKLKVDVSHVNYDLFIKYVIKSNKYDDKIIPLEKELLQYQTLFINEIERMKRYDEVPLIEFLKYEAGLSWNEIDNFLCSASGTSKKKWNRYKSIENK